MATIAMHIASKHTHAHVHLLCECEPRRSTIVNLASLQSNTYLLWFILVSLITSLIVVVKAINALHINHHLSLV